MKEHPILFSTEMIQAYKAGRKTQTRRLKKSDKCPFGKAGDKLWFKETFCEKGGLYPVEKYYIYRADYITNNGNTEIIHPSNKWKPSIFMPRIASRFNPTILSIRKERLLDISEEDAAAEGVYASCGFVGTTRDIKKLTERDRQIYKFRPDYFQLWDRINGKDSHKLNPMVWVIEFEGLEEIK